MSTWNQNDWANMLSLVMVLIPSSEIQLYFVFVTVVDSHGYYGFLFWVFANIIPYFCFINSITGNIICVHTNNERSNPPHQAAQSASVITSPHSRQCNNQHGIATNSIGIQLSG